MPDTAQFPLSSKRRKVTSYDTAVKSSSKVPQIFAPFRSIGIVANHVPPAIQVRGKAYHVTTCVGKSFQTYDVCPFYYLLTSSVCKAESVVCRRGDK